MNSVPRVVEVLDRSEEQRGSVGRKAARERADTSNLGSVAAPMAGEVVDVKAKPGVVSLQCAQDAQRLCAALLQGTSALQCMAWWHHAQGMAPYDVTSFAPSLRICRQHV